MSEEGFYADRIIYADVGQVWSRQLQSDALAFIGLSLLLHERND